LPIIVRPVILAGGAGTRLWPLSRKGSPKQFLPIVSAIPMLVETLSRFNTPDFEAPIIIAGEEHLAGLEEQIQQSGISVEAILLEPVARSTAGAATLAAEWLWSTGRDDLLLLAPADHRIGNASAFHTAVRAGIAAAADGAIITFGIVPHCPSTEYGYVEAQGCDPKPLQVLPVARFIEKPNAEVAATYVASPRFFWNSGIFLLKASTLIEQMREFLPDSLDAISRSVAQASREGPLVRPDPLCFSEAENISIDYGVMEKTTKALVIPVQMAWSDVGSWAAVWEIASKDADHNSIEGDVVVIDTRNCLLRNDGPQTIGAIGLEDFVVIAAGDAILIAPISRAADVKSLVEKLSEQPAGNARR
jgi:mannose-1-phosphate guanylyltransferase/mannose-6-phosphate isomerase